MSRHGNLQPSDSDRQQQAEADLNGNKVCPKCGDTLPLAEFDVDRSKPDGHKSWCKTCRATSELEKNNQKIVRNQDAMQELFARIDGEALLSLSIAVSGGTNVPHQIQALEEIIALFGGVKGFALHFVATYQAAAPGSATRERMLLKLLTAIQVASEGGGVSKPRELMSDEELEAAAREHALRIAKDTLDIRDSA